MRLQLGNPNPITANVFGTFEEKILSTIVEAQTGTLSSFSTNLVTLRGSHVKWLTLLTHMQPTGKWGSEDPICFFEKKKQRCPEISFANDDRRCEVTSEPS